MEIVLNEREFVEKKLRHPSLGTHPSRTIEKVARYYIESGDTQQEATQKVHDYLVACDSHIILKEWKKCIRRSINAATRNPLVVLEYIPITQAELDICSSFSSQQMQRLMFTLIALAKYRLLSNSKYKGWISIPHPDIFAAANIVASSTRQTDMLKDLGNAGLISFSRKVNNLNICVNCLDDNGEAVMHITDFRNLGYQYMKHMGGSFISCKSCGLVVRRNSNVQKYCTACAADIHREKMLLNYYRSMLQ